MIAKVEVRIGETVVEILSKAGEESYTPEQRETVYTCFDYSEVKRNLESRLEDYAYEWLQEEVDRLLEEHGDAAEQDAAISAKIA